MNVVLWRPQTYRTGVAIAMFGMVIMSVDSVLIRLLSRTLPLANVIFWRGIGTAIGFTVIAWLTSSDKLRNSFKRIGRIGLLIATINLCGNVLFVTAITYTTVAHTLVIIAIAPVLTAILAQVLIREPAAPRVWMASVGVVIGIGAIFLASPKQGDLFGDFMALAGSAGVALMFVVLRRALKVSMVPAYAVGGLLTSLVAAPFVTRFSLSPSEAILAAAVGVFVLPVSLSLVIQSLRLVGAPEVGLIMLLEVLLGPIWVLVIIGEVPDSRTLLSGAVILLALATNYLLEWDEHRRRAAKPTRP